MAGSMLVTLVTRRHCTGTKMGKLLVLMITAFVDMVGFAMVLPLIPFYAKNMGATGFMVGVLISAFSVAQLLSDSDEARVIDSGSRPAASASSVTRAHGSASDLGEPQLCHTSA